MKTTWVAIAAVMLTASGALCAEDLSRAETSAGDVAVLWRAGVGTEITWRDVAAFTPYGSQYVVHDAAWTRHQYTSRSGTPRASLAEADGEQVIAITDSTDVFSFTKTISLHPDGRLVIEHEFGQTGLDDAHLQLGMLPAVPWLDGARYRVVTGEGQETGRMTHGRGDRRVLWSDIRELSFESLFGTWTMTSTHGMTLYDDRDKGSFFLGWDQVLEDGERYTERLELTFEPVSISAAGLRIDDFTWEREVRDGRANLYMTVTPQADGAEGLRLRLQAMRGDEMVAETSQPAATGDVELALALPDPGEYELQFGVGPTDGAPEFEQLLTCRVYPLMRFMPGLSLYTHEAQAELLLMLNEIPEAEVLQAHLTGEVLGGRRTVDIAGMQTVIPIDLAEVADGEHEVQCALIADAETLARGEATIRKAPPKPNEVKIDYRSRGLVVDGKPFFPFGFYIHHGRYYDQDDPQFVLGLEGAFGFNMICVYQNFDFTFRQEVRPVVNDFLDRADATGFRMHYDVRNMTDQEPTEELAAQIEEDVIAHRDDPALLCWYLSDEPAGRGNPPDRYIAHNRQMKQLDPHHPTTMVFCVPSKAHEYTDGMDILMVDPYPIAHRPVTQVAETVDLVRNATGGQMPIWCVPQAFGGGEAWFREPSWQEQRCMTYMAIAHGATGIQYFIRRPPHTSPFVDGMWAECRKMAREIRELTPALLSHEPEPTVEPTEPVGDLHLTARRYNGHAYVLAVNSAHEPRAISLQCSEAPTEDRAEVMFENRGVPVTGEGVIEDMIDALGVRVYRYQVGEEQVGPVTLDPANLVRNGGFEFSVNPGYPDGCRVGYPGELTGAGWGTDPQEAVEGTHSLFLRSTKDGEGLSATTFPTSLSTGTYEVSLYLKADRPGMTAHIGVSGWRTWKDSVTESVEVAQEWTKHTIPLQMPVDERRVHVSFRPEQRGTLWVDAVQILPVAQEDAGG